jgi:hypothetical protein
LEPILAASKVVLDSLRSGLFEEKQKSERLEKEMKNMELKHQQEKEYWERKQRELDSEHQSTISSLKKEISMLKKQNLKLTLKHLLEIEDHLKTFQLL